MFAIDPVFEPQGSDQIDPSILHAALSSMSDDELSQLEDDLDFCNFAGVPSPRVLRILEMVVELDDGWRSLLKQNRRLSVPTAY